MSEDFDKYFKMSKIKNRPLCLDEVLKMIKKIDDVNVDGEVPYDKHWITTKTRKDEASNQDVNIGNKNHGYFIIPAVLKT